MGRRIIFFLISLLTCSIAQTQDLQTYLTLGQNALIRGDAYTAIYYFEQALAIDAVRPDIWFLKGEAARAVHDYTLAKNAYLHALPLNDDSLCVAWLYNGLMLKQMGSYNEAMASFREYRRLCQSDPQSKVRADHELQSCEFAMNAILDSVGVLTIRLGPEVNTGFSEFAAQQLGDSLLYFSSLRPFRNTAANSYIPDDSYTQLYISRISPAGWMASQLADNRLNRGRAHVVDAFFTSDKSEVYFARCSSKKNIQRHCILCKSELKRNKWTKPRPLQAGINLDKYSSVQPCYVIGEKYDVLYFSSDRPGGFGGFDIWYSIVHDGEFGQPVNLGSLINTKGHELSPFFYDDKLYFSSDWHYGLGGLDIFRAVGSLNSWGKPENLMSPINSPAEDLYFSINDDGSSGYFTSNRQDGSLPYAGTCCYDIFHYEIFSLADTVPSTNTIPDEIDSLAKSLLPLALYFDNDIPDPGSKLPTTRIDYLTTLRAYSGMMPKYQSEYSRGLHGTASEKARNDIRLFFDNQVEGGFGKLQSLCEYILMDLATGQDVRLEISGYTSPLNTTEYNYNLAQRRIESLRNYFLLYKDGILNPYISDTLTTTPKLEIISIPVGERLSAHFVSDNPNDVRNSIYSIAAATERRIEITNYVSGHNIQENQEYAQLTLLDARTSLTGVTGKNILATMQFINSGQGPLTLLKITSECNCINTSYPDVEIKPGEKGNIYILIPSSEPGYYSSQVEIEFSPAKERLILPLQWFFSAP